MRSKQIQMSTFAAALFLVTLLIANRSAIAYRLSSSALILYRIATALFNIAPCAAAPRRAHWMAIEGLWEKYLQITLNSGI